MVAVDACCAEREGSQIVAGYTPLFSNLTTGTLCGRWPDIGLWPVILSVTDDDGLVDCNPRCISALAGLPLADVVACIGRFCEGGRLELIEPGRQWGWRLVGYEARLWREAQTRPRPPPTVWRELRAFVFARDDFTCQYCGARGGSLQCDHIIPFSKGGSNELDNLVTACKPCNQSKRDKTLDEWMQ